LTFRWRECIGLARVTEIVRMPDLPVDDRIIGVAHAKGHRDILLWQEPTPPTKRLGLAAICREFG